MADAAVVVILEDGSVGQPHRVHRVFDKKQRLNAPAAAAWALGSFSIGRGGPVSLRIEQPHISATQCTISPPAPESPGWRLADFSTNGTLVNGTLVGKGNAVEIHDGDTINFSLRPYPYAIFRERFDDAVTDAAAAAATGAPAAALAASAAGAKKRRVACAEPGAVASAGGVASSPSSHEAMRRSSASNAAHAVMQEELARSQRQLQETEAKLQGVERSAAEAAKEQARVLAEREEAWSAKLREAQHEARAVSERHETELDKQAAALRALEQRLAAAEERAAAGAATLALSREQAVVEREQREQLEATLRAKAQALEAATYTNAELQHKLAAAAEAQEIALREVALARAEVEAARRKGTEGEARLAELGAKLEAARAELGTLHEAKRELAQALRAAEGARTEASICAEGWKRKHEEWSARSAGELNSAQAQVERLQAEVAALREHESSHHSQLAASFRRLQAGQERASALQERARTTRAAVGFLVATAAEMQRAVAIAHAAALEEEEAASEAVAAEASSVSSEVGASPGGGGGGGGGGGLYGGDGGENEDVAGVTQPEPSRVAGGLGAVLGAPAPYAFYAGSQHSSEGGPTQLDRPRRTAPPSSLTPRAGRDYDVGATQQPDAETALEPAPTPAPTQHEACEPDDDAMAPTPVLALGRGGSSTTRPLEPIAEGVHPLDTALRHHRAAPTQTLDEEGDGVACDADGGATSSAGGVHTANRTGASSSVAGSRAPSVAAASSAASAAARSSGSMPPYLQEQYEQMAEQQQVTPFGTQGSAREDADDDTDDEAEHEVAYGANTDAEAVAQYGANTAADAETLYEQDDDPMGEHVEVINEVIHAGETAHGGHQGPGDLGGVTQVQRDVDEPSPMMGGGCETLVQGFDEDEDA